MLSSRNSTAGAPPPASLRPGYVPANIAVLVKDNHASKLAVKLAKTLIQNPAKDRLTLIHMVSSELASYSAEQKVLSQFNQDAYYQPCVQYKVLVQAEGVRLAELVQEAVTHLNPHLLVIGSQGLCNDILTELEQSRKPGGSKAATLAPLGTTIRRKPARMATAMRFAQALHQQVPMLFVKATSVGAFSTGASGGLRCMIDLTSTARHGLEWLLGRLNPNRGDSMVLAVGKAMDSNDQVRQHAVRLLTTFGVQASVSQLGGARKRMFKEPSHVGLPGAVAQDDIDILMVQAPRCRDLPAATYDILTNARTAVLIWPPDRMADGTVVKPPHPLRQLLDETVPEEERPLLRPKDQAENLVLDGPWKGRGPRYSFRERDGGPGDPAMYPLANPMMLRRSLSDALLGEGASRFGRMERALNRSMTTQAARTGRWDGGAEDDSYDLGHSVLDRSSGGASSQGGHSRAALAAVVVAEEPDDEIEYERNTWPPKAGAVPWQRPIRVPPAGAMDRIAEEPPTSANRQKRASSSTNSELPTIASGSREGAREAAPAAKAVRAPSHTAFGRALPPGTLPMLRASSSSSRKSGTSAQAAAAAVAEEENAAAQTAPQAPSQQQQGQQQRGSRPHEHGPVAGLRSHQPMVHAAA